MAKFCGKCGRPLKDGEVCNCTSNSDKKDENKVQNNNESVHNDNSTNVIDILKGISNGIANLLDDIYYAITPSDKSSDKSSAVAIRKLMGFSQEDYIKPIENVYERGERLTPDLIQPCSEEIIIRQYDICTVRSAIKGLWQDGRLLITNKRILFRLSGRNWRGKEQSSKEFAVEDIAGIDMSYSSKVNFISIVCNILIAAFPSYLGALLGKYIPTLAMILGIFLYLFFLFFLRGHYTFKSIMFFIALNLTINSASVLGEFGEKICIIAIIITIWNLYLASLRPSFKFKVLTKCATDSPISAEKFRITIENIFPADILPGKDAERAMDELGAMINDIQKYGDYGVEKWKAI